MTRLADPDAVLRGKIVEFVDKADFGLASGQQNGGFARVWFEQPVGPEEVAFDADVFLLTKVRTKALVRQAAQPETKTDGPAAATTVPAVMSNGTAPTTTVLPAQTDDPRRILRISGILTPEIWNKLGVRLLPRLRGCGNLKLGIDFSCEVEAGDATNLSSELGQAINELGMGGSLNVTVDKP